MKKQIIKITLWSCYILMVAGCSDIGFVEAFAKDNNIYVLSSKGVSKQLTFLGKDEQPIMSPENKNVFFVRKTGNLGEYEYEGVEQLAIMKVAAESQKEEKLMDTIQYADRKETSKIFEVKDLTVSEDGNFLFFVMQKWSTSGVLVKLNLKTLATTEISHGDTFQLLKEGNSRNNIIVNRSAIKDNAGRQWSNWLIDTNGKNIKEIGDESAVAVFIESNKKKD